MLSQHANYKEHTLVVYALRASRPMAIVCAVLATFACLGYFGDMEIFYRPLSGGVATHPLTAILAILIGLSFCLHSSKHKTLVKILMLVSLLLLVSKFMDVIWGLHTLSLFTPFVDIIEQQKALGKPNEMGLNTALMMLFLCGSVLFRLYGRTHFSQTFAFIALSIPTIAITGYAYHIDFLYGDMSLLTNVLGLLLSFTALGISSNHGVIRTVLSPYIGGKLSRVQMFLGYVFPFLFGFLLHPSLLQHGASGLFGAYVVSVCWFIILLVIVSAVVHERVDKKRRYAERALFLAATRDSLTNLLNRRAFAEEVILAVAREQRNDGQLYILMIDIDYFKQVNDKYGHVVGDKVLIQVANELKRSVRQTDLVCRYGGEEFIVLLSGTNLVGTKQVAETIRNNVENIVIKELRSAAGAITVSIGCAEFDLDERLESATDKADRALFEAKEQGRNSIVVYQVNKQ